MANYPYRMQLVVDPDNPRNIVAGGSVSIYDSEDTGKTTLLALTDPTGTPIPNPIQSNSQGLTPPFVTTSPEVLWVSGEYTDYFQSYKGMLEEALAARDAAETAAAAAGAAAQEDIAARVAAGELKGRDGANGRDGVNGSNVLPTQEAIEQAIIADGPAKNALKTAYKPQPANVLPSASLVACYGESTTASSGTNWPVTYLQPYTGMTAVNAGISGQGVADVLFRAGAIKPRVTVAGNTIPASGSVAVTNVDPATGWRINGSGTFGFDATIAGVPGSFQHNLVDNTWAFIRTTAGDPVTVQPDTLVDRPDAYRHKRHRLVVGTGRNNVLDGSLPVAARLMELLPEAQDTQVKEILVWGVINGTDEPTGHARRAAIVDYNAKLAAHYGDNFYDIRRDFIDTGLTRAGLEATTADATNIANDCPPPSLMADNIHPNPAGYEVIARLLAEKVKELGWVNTITIPADPALASILTSDTFDRADTAAGTLGTTNAALGGTAKAWTSDSQLQILSNQVGATTLTSNRHATVDVGVTDMHVSLRIMQPGDGCGVVARWADNANYYYITITATGTWGAYSRVAGAGTAILTGTGTIVAGDTIGLAVQGSTVKLYKNGTLNGSITNTALTTGTRAGIRSAFNNNAWRADDFKVTDK